MRATLRGSHQLVCVLLWCLVLLLTMPAAHAQTFRFSLRAEPDVIQANGISTSSIFVQLQDTGIGTGITAVPLVRFATTAGTIEPQALLSNNVARVLLRSSSTPGTAIVTAFIGNAREQVAVEFTNESVGDARFMQLAGDYVAYGGQNSLVTASGHCVLEYGPTHIESDVRLDIDIANQCVWAEGGAGKVMLRQGYGKKANTLTGDRLFYDMRRRRGVMRRADTTLGPGRQEFMDSDFKPIPDSSSEPESAPPAVTSKHAAARPAPAAPIAPPLALTSPVAPSPPTASPVTLPVNQNAPASSTTGKSMAATIQSIAMVEPPVTPPGQDDKEAPHPDAPPQIAPYHSLPDAGPQDRIHLSDPLPPDADSSSGYWVTAKLLRIYPRDKIQFQHATVFFNGRRMFSRPLYIATLGSGFNPATDLLSFNSEGGPTINIPFYFQANPHGTGTLFLQRAPGSGFAAEKSGFAAAIDEQYWLKQGSEGRLDIDQLGHGDWNLNWNHTLQFSPTASGSLYFDMPEHKDAYLRTSLLKQFRTMDVGVEGFYSKPRTGPDDSQGQFFARLRPKQIGATGWTYSFAGNVTAYRRYAQLYESSGPSGGNGTPLFPNQQYFATRYAPDLAQTLNLTFQGPVYSLWHGAGVQASLLGTAYNYSDGRHGVAPGMRVGVQQLFGKIAALQVDYNYDRSTLDLLGGTYTHYVSGSLSLKPAKNLMASTYLSRSLTDGSVYGSSELDYYLKKIWRIGLFTDYSHFPETDSLMNYGLSLGRTVGTREITLNWDRYRHHVYFEMGGFRY